MARGTQNAYLDYDPTRELIGNFSASYPHIPLRVHYDFWMPPQGLPAIAYDDEECGEVVPRIALNPHRPYVALVEALVEALAVCSFWSAEKGMPENGDPRLTAEEQNKRQAEMKSGLAQQSYLAKLRPAGRVQ